MLSLSFPCLIFVPLGPASSYMFVFLFRYEGGEEEERDVFEELAARGAAAGAPAIPVSQPPRHQPTITEVRA
jgi:hypothetical protein